MFAEVTQINDQNQLTNKIEEYNKEVSVLWDKLMGLELQLVDQLEVKYDIHSQIYILAFFILYYIYIF